MELMLRTILPIVFAFAMAIQIIRMKREDDNHNLCGVVRYGFTLIAYAVLLITLAFR